MVLITKNTKHSFSNRYLNKQLFTSRFIVCYSFSIFVRVRDPNYGKKFVQVLTFLFMIDKWN